MRRHGYVTFDPAEKPLTYNLIIDSHISRPRNQPKTRMVHVKPAAGGTYLLESNVQRLAGLSVVRSGSTDSLRPRLSPESQPLEANTPASSKKLWFQRSGSGQQ